MEGFGSRADFDLSTAMAHDPGAAATGETGRIARGVTMPEFPARNRTIPELKPNKYRGPRPARFWRLCGTHVRASIFALGWLVRA